MSINFEEKFLQKIPAAIRAAGGENESEIKAFKDLNQSLEDVSKSLIWVTRPMLQPSAIGKHLCADRAETAIAVVSDQ